MIYVNIKKQVSPTKEKKIFSDEVETRYFVILETTKSLPIPKYKRQLLLIQNSRPKRSIFF